MIVRKLLLLRRLCLHHPFLLRGRCDFPASEMMTFAEVKKVLGLDEILGIRETLRSE